jgi:hypothetical protein
MIMFIFFLITPKFNGILYKYYKKMVESMSRKSYCNWPDFLCNCLYSFSTLDIYTCNIIILFLHLNTALNINNCLAGSFGVIEGKLATHSIQWHFSAQEIKHQVTSSASFTNVNYIQIDVTKYKTKIWLK